MIAPASWQQLAPRARLLPPAVAASAVLLAGCGGHGPKQVALAELAERQQTFAGQEIDTAGIVYQERDPDGKTYFVIADEAGDLVGLKPDAKARAYAGKRVDVRGRFELERGFGRILRIATIRSSRG